MRVTFVAPDFHAGGPENIVGSLPPLNLLYLGGALRHAGFSNLSLVDLNKLVAPGTPREEVVESMLRGRPDLVFIGGAASTPSFPRTVELAEGIKEMDKDVLVVTGGTHPTFKYKDIISRPSPFDYIILGEGETPAQELLCTLDRGGDMRSVKNLVWKSPSGSYVINPMGNSHTDLDLILPQWDLISDWGKYKAPASEEIVTTLQYSRGCGFRCTFCGQWEFWRGWHCRAPVSVAAEVEWLHKKHGVSLFFWADENPGEDQLKWLELLEKLSDANERCSGRLHHMLNTRVDYVVRDEPHLPLYRRAGIQFIDLGMEAAVQQRLDQFHKRTTVETNKRCLELLRQNDIISIVQIQLGHPDDTLDFLEESLRNLILWNPDLLHFYYVTPFPWTVFGHQMADKIVETDISKWDYRHPVLRLDHLSSDVLVSWAKRAKIIFDFNPERLMSIFQIEDDYRRRFIIGSLVRSLKYRAGQAALSTFL